MKLIKSMLVAVMMISLTTNSVAQTVEVVGPKVPVKATKPIDFNSPKAKEKVVEMIKELDLCKLNQASTKEAFDKCTNAPAYVPQYWQTPMFAIGAPLVGIIVGILVGGLVKK